MRTLLIIFAFAVASHACGVGSGCVEKLERIATALERIANIMQNEHNAAVQQRTAVREKLPPKNYDVKVNGRSLKAEPSSYEFELEEPEPELSCIDQCKHDNYSNHTIIDCIRKNCR